ncbi:hypothetical protein QBC40DRAFT_165076 [Triangularia verruculosa]|uniref:Urease accessory protein UreF n=1 Tax=Triangularia verruculosa TaxID=2587418 RepID=A0AAN6XPU0_9PEZI|nr:hypothetical protein QBC40DRAFT_165076 [Triangularia verruculosa]
MTIDSIQDQVFSHPKSETDLENEIAELERKLATAKAKLSPHNPLRCRQPPKDASPEQPLSTPNLSHHYHLLLSDSALPLGSFAFSSGLESYLAHGHKSDPYHPHTSFAAFLPLSISSYASTTLPFVLSAHRDPSLSNLVSLDDTQDASIICTVGRRASIAQGRALLGIWERSFSLTFPSSPRQPAAVGDLKEFARLVKRSSSKEIPDASAHLAPLFGAVCSVVGLTLQQTAYMFLFGHVKALVSAAVRAGMFGPYQAQKVLAGATVQELITEMIKREWDTVVENAGQNVPVMDLWFGRHEVLYSRIFNS